ncbi:hypothetical protein [Aeromicrobium sp. 179-A 4D2 NHS]|uniref:hypothetical protein n=1 Tax=Aeromicrobium sp. 179-A 4D2 NHS TaxID=3142375 RepID=UPI00399F5285
MYLLADQHKPAGRVGRTEAIFASPTLEGVGRWVRGNAFNTRIADVKVREITVNADDVWVYSIDAWESASHSQVEHAQDRGKAGFETYWSSGMTLTDWLADGTLDAGEWECLLDPSLVLGVRPVSAKRVAAAQTDDDWAADILRALR